jgi:hypothetical protein
LINVMKVRRCSEVMGCTGPLARVQPEADEHEDHTEEELWEKGDAEVGVEVMDRNGQLGATLA